MKLVVHGLPKSCQSLAPGGTAELGEDIEVTLSEGATEAIKRGDMLVIKLCAASDRRQITLQTVSRDTYQTQRSCAAVVAVACLAPACLDKAGRCTGV